MFTFVTLLHLLVPSLLIHPIVDLPRSDVVHVSSGLIFHYITQYSPADRIVSFTVSIPMTWDMCYLIPPKAIRKIPGCYRPVANSSRQAPPRRKRFITGLVAIGIGSAALALSTHNSIQILRLNHEIRAVSNSSSTLTDTTNAHTTQLYHLNQGQLKLAHSLNNTQSALNRTIALVNEHSLVLGEHNAAIEQLALFAQLISHKLSTSMHSIDTHFLHTSLSDILNNRLNLHFIHHKDLPNVLESIISSTNVSFNADSTSLPLVELVSRLLIQQHINFLPRTNHPTVDDSIIGVLSISSFFAATTNKKTTFSLFELLPIPFPYEGIRVRLADMPYIVGFDSNNRNLIRWTKSESTSCDFRTMSVCRETPPIITDWNDTCIFQILADSTLSLCRTEQYREPIFIHPIGKQWAISTNSSTQCHSTFLSPTEQSYAFHNNLRTLPAVALITIPPDTVLICDRFSISAAPLPTGPSLSLLDSSIFNTSGTDTIDLYQHLSNSTRWSKLPYISDNFQAVLDFIAKTSPPPATLPINHPHQHPFSYLAIAFVLITLVLLGFLLYCHRARKSTVPAIQFQLPTICSTVSS
ncbi:unnamed protein product [Rotaria socialis]